MTSVLPGRMHSARSGPRNATSGRPAPRDCPGRFLATPPPDRALLFDSGNTLMEDIPGFSGPDGRLAPRGGHPGGSRSAGQPETLLAPGDGHQRRRFRRARHPGGVGRAALDPLIDEIYCSRRLGHKKPSPEFFQAVLADLGLPAGRVVMVGDSLEGDVLGAVRAGLRAVWFHPAGPETIETPQIRTMHNFPTLPALVSERSSPDLAPPGRDPIITADLAHRSNRRSAQIIYD